MRITVISDSHRRSGVIDKILSARDDSTHIFFLGDLVSDMDDFELLYPEKKFHIVSGNCDGFSLYPYVGLEILNGVRIMYTHGHTFSVKYGTSRLLEAAKQNNCQIVLYGHTHVSNILYEDGIYIVNPGSVSSPRDSSRASYAVIDITDKGIMPIIIEV